MLGESFDIYYEVLSNVDDSLCWVYILKGDCFLLEFIIVIMVIFIEVFMLFYFSYIVFICGYDLKNVICIEYINGDLYCLMFEDKVSISD